MGQETFEMTSQDIEKIVELSAQFSGFLMSIIQDPLAPLAHCKEVGLEIVEDDNPFNCYVDALSKIMKLEQPLKDELLDSLFDPYIKGEESKKHQEVLDRLREHGHLWDMTSQFQEMMGLLHQRQVASTSN